MLLFQKQLLTRTARYISVLKKDHLFSAKQMILNYLDSTAFVPLKLFHVL